MGVSKLKIDANYNNNTAVKSLHKSIWPPDLQMKFNLANISQI